MTPLLAPALVAALAQLAALDADVGVRADARSTTLETSGAPTISRTAIAISPTATGLMDVSGLRLTLTYAPRLWTSDVGVERTPLVDHAVEGRVGTYREGWRGEASVGVVRGRTDALSPPLLTSQSNGSPQVASTHALLYHEFRTGAVGEILLSPRTTVGGGASWQYSRPAGESLDLPPPQWRLSGDVFIGHQVTELDSVRLGASGARTVTGGIPGLRPGALGVSTTAVLTWRRRLTQYVEGWIGGGASWLYSDRLEPGHRLETEPAAEVGLARGGEELKTSFHASLRTTAFIDRYTGEVSPSVEGRLSVGFRLGPRALLSVAAIGGGRTDGETVVGGGDARFTWMLREGLSFDVGIAARGQEERRPERPSFVEAGVFTSVTFRQERLFGSGAVDAPRVRAAEDAR